MPLDRRLVSSGSPYEPRVGISRAVRIGPFVAVTGTAPLGPDGETVGLGDAGTQARRCLQIIEAALTEGGASLQDVIRPANTIMQIGAFIRPEWLVEIEADAICPTP